MPTGLHGIIDDPNHSNLVNLFVPLNTLTLFPVMPHILARKCLVAQFLYRQRGIRQFEALISAYNPLDFLGATLLLKLHLDGGEDCGISTRKSRSTEGCRFGAQTQNTTGPTRMSIKADVLKAAPSVSVGGI